MSEMIKKSPQPGIQKVANWLTDIASTATTIGLWTVGLSLAGAAGLGAGAGYLAARKTSPDLATATTEQDLAQEALETEIDITRRQIAQLERRKAAEKKAEKKKVYDRFV